MSLEQFDLVGVRYKRYHFDESVLLNQKGRAKIASHYEISTEDPTVSPFFFKGRKVIEVVVSVKQFVQVDEQPEATGTQKESEPKEVLTVECVAGFVGTSQENDGNLELFTTSEESWGRVIYWLVRQRIRSLMMGTLLDSKGLPLDFRDPRRSNGTPKGQGTKAKKTSTTKKARKTKKADSP